MSLYKRPGFPHYWCRFTLGGRRIRQSTGTTDRKAAEDYEHRLRGRIWRETRLSERTGTWDQAVKKWGEERTVRASTKHRDAKPVAEFAVLTGLRTANIRELLWSRVDLDRAHAWIPAQSTKGGRVIGIALSADAVTVLKGNHPGGGAGAGVPLSGAAGQQRLWHESVAQGLQAGRVSGTAVS